MNDSKEMVEKKRLSPKQKKLLMIGCPVLIAAVCLILIAAGQNESDENVSDAASLEPYVSMVEDEDNDILAIALSSGEYASTVLQETDDAGVDYAKETLFIGDSNTAGMLNHSSTTNVTMDNGIGIVSMGISHVTSLKCVKFRGMSAVAVPEAVKIMQPRRIVINFGTNDYYMNPEKYAETYRNALEAIETAYPYSDIIIASVFPITSNCSYHTVNMPTVEKFNLELVKLAQAKDLKFLNWSEALKDQATGFCVNEYMAGDGVHLSKKGMEQIAHYFRTHSLEGEDRRPKPLNPIPYREPTPFGLLGVGLNNEGAATDIVSAPPVSEEPVTPPPQPDDPGTGDPGGGDPGGGGGGDPGTGDPGGGGGGDPGGGGGGDPGTGDPGDDEEEDPEGGGP